MKQKLPKHFKLQKGFTLIELLIVVTILTVLSVSVFVALNPARRLVEAKDARRATDVQEILTAIHQSIVDNGGSTPTNLPASPNERQLGTGNSTDCTAALSAKGCGTPAATACANLMTGAVNVSNYLASMPIDPLGGTTYNAVKTGYSVKNTNGMITVTACAAEGTNNISASR